MTPETDDEQPGAGSGRRGERAAAPSSLGRLARFIPFGARLGRVDQVLVRLGHNVAYLMSASVLVALIGLVTVGVTARALGPVAFGVLAMIEAYVRAVDGLVRPEPWQAVIRYGASALEEDRQDAFLRVVKAGVLTDLAGAALAALLAVAGALSIGPRFGLDPEHTTLFALCGLMLAFSITATPTAVLRLYNRFGLISRLAVIFAAARLGFSLAAWAVGGLQAFVLALVATHCLDGIVTAGAAWRELARRGQSGFWRVPLRGVLAENKGIVAFVINANVVVQARQSTQRFDTLIVGALTDAASVGFYQLAKRIGLAALRASRPLTQALYPDIARLWARGEHARFRRIVIQMVAATTLLALIPVCVVAFHAEWLVSLFFGAEFAPAAPLLVVQAFAVVALVAGISLGPALYSLGLDRPLAWLTAVGALGFFLALALLTPRFGPIGASFAHLIFNATLSASALYLLLKATRATTHAPRAATPA